MSSLQDRDLIRRVPCCGDGVTLILRRLHFNARPCTDQMFVGQLKLHDPEILSQ